MEKRLEELKNVSLEQTLKNPKKLIKFYKEFFNDDVCGHCPPIIKARWEKLFTLDPVKIRRALSRVLKMIPGRAINTYSSNSLPQGYWTASNITDEVAIQLIEAGHIRNFANPEDLQKAKDSLTA